MLKIATNRINYRLLAIIPGGIGTIFTTIASFTYDNHKLVFGSIGVALLIITGFMLKILKPTCLVEFDQEKNEVLIRPNIKQQLTIPVNEILNIRELYFFPIHSQGHKSSNYSQYGIVFKSEGKKIVLPFIIYDSQTELIDNFEILRSIIIKQRHQKIQHLK